MTNADSSEPYRIMFICLGNICRSPAAQGVMEGLVRSRGLAGRIEVDSSGTASYHIGKRPDARMVAAAGRRGIELTSFAKAFVGGDVERRDLVIAMDGENFGDIVRKTGKRENVRLLNDYLGQGWPRNVPDPYYGGESGFEVVLDMLEAACPEILSEWEALKGRTSLADGQSSM